MDLLKATHSYVERMVGSTETRHIGADSEKLKILLLDQETVSSHGPRTRL
jgi:hypothetical protein